MYYLYKKNKLINFPPPTPLQEPVLVPIRANACLKSTFKSQEQKLDYAEREEVF